ncbi:hypothetical protein [Photobacterium rosenbergii]|uniref:hypothetical protein n=1 Tax=Photobacterium rosenbergii TaxID=294936 RepID=UPI001C9924B8|nr:hypothetical protein [Photobacterium rosenbergii]MBY5948401.1 hypothetical protein [Photobacterium rosenbergii]
MSKFTIPLFLTTLISLSFGTAAENYPVRDINQYHPTNSLIQNQSDGLTMFQKRFAILPPFLPNSEVKSHILSAIINDKESIGDIEIRTPYALHNKNNKISSINH